MLWQMLGMSHVIFMDADTLQSSSYAKWTPAAGDCTRDARGRNERIYARVRHSFARKSIKFNIPKIVQVTTRNTLDKIVTH